ncbi:putative adipose-regulatory protein-domain-containing protein [Paraphysoderma sedebokerense]|nr:putative adipose-regulatory protein-domain-containing protein [Paraphysoderma sedebokerense]
MIREFVTSAKTQRFLLKSIIFAFLFFLLFAIAVTTYAVFYWLYVPEIVHKRDIYMQYSRDPNVIPTGHLLLTPDPYGYLLAPNQPYDISLTLHVPLSSSNMELKNFMVTAALLTSQNETLYFASRPATLVYQSPLARYMQTVFYAVPLILGYSNVESQTFQVPLVENVVSPPDVNDPNYQTHIRQWKYYQEVLPDFPSPPSSLSSVSIDPTKPKHATQIVVTFSDPNLKIYKTVLNLDAHFRGLRYFMYYWFFTSACIGVGVVMVWEVLFGLAFWRVIIGKVGVEEVEAEEEEEYQRRIQTTVRRRVIEDGQEIEYEQVVEEEGEGEESVTGEEYEYESESSQQQPNYSSESSSRLPLFQEETEEEQDTEDTETAQEYVQTTNFTRGVPVGVMAQTTETETDESDKENQNTSTSARTTTAKPTTTGASVGVSSDSMRKRKAFSGSLESSRGSSPSRPSDQPGPSSSTIPSRPKSVETPKKNILKEEHSVEDIKTETKKQVTPEQEDDQEVQTGSGSGDSENDVQSEGSIVDVGNAGDVPEDKQG